MCHLQGFYDKYKSKGLMVLGIDPADNRQIALGFLHESGATFPNIIDASEAAEKTTQEDYPIGAWPTSYIIGRDGKILAAWVGYREGEPLAIAAMQKAGGELAAAVRQELIASVAKAAPEVAAAAQRLFQVLRDADYDHDGISTRDWKHQPAKQINYNPRAQ